MKIKYTYSTIFSRASQNDDFIGANPIYTVVYFYIGESGERCPGFYYVIYYSKMTIGKQKLGVSTEADIIFLQKYHTFVPEI